MGPSEDSASTRLWLGIFWPTRTRFFWKSQDSDSIGLDFLRLGLDFFWLDPSLLMLALGANDDDFFGEFVLSRQILFEEIHDGQK